MARGEFGCSVGLMDPGMLRHVDRVPARCKFRFEGFDEMEDHARVEEGGTTSSPTTCCGCELLNPLA